MNVLVAFDLDDTLIPEVQFLRSGFRHIARWLHDRLPRLSPQLIISRMETAAFNHLNHYSALESYLASESISRDYIDMREIVTEFRCHRPDPEFYHLSPSMRKILTDLRDCGTPLALISDGRSLTQRNKIEAAGLYDFFGNRDIIISEESGHDKTDPDNFVQIMEKNPGIDTFHYVADNPVKDFTHPVRLGWHVHLAKPFPLMIHRPGYRLLH